MRPALRIPALLILMSPALVAPAAHAGGLRCSVGEVVVENLKIGHRYSLRMLANLPLVVTNTADGAVGLAIEPLVPGESELRQNAAPIPDPHWASVTPDTFPLAAGQQATADMVLNIPDDASLLGRKFEVVFWSHTLPNPAELVAVGLKSRVIFSIDPVRDTTAVEPTGELGIQLESADFALSNLKGSRQVRIEDIAKTPVTLRNTSNRTLRVGLDALVTPATVRRGDGDLLAVARVRLDPATVTLGPGESRVVTGVITPHGSRAAHRRYRCTIAATVLDLPVRTGIQSQLCGVAQ